MRLSDKQINMFLFTTLGVGAVFGAIFLAAYLGGLPSTATLSTEPAFRIALSIVGAVFSILVLSALFLAIITKQKS